MCILLVLYLQLDKSRFTKLPWQLFFYLSVVYFCKIYCMCFTSPTFAPSKKLDHQTTMPNVFLITLNLVFIEIILRHGCSPVNLLHIFRIPFLKAMFIEEKTSQLQPGQPDASVSWDDFDFHLHESLHPGLQG